MPGVGNTSRRGIVMWSSAALLIEERAEAKGVRLALAGELDLATRNELRVRLCRSRARGDHVQLDLSRLEFIDAAGAGLLIRAFAHSRKHGWELSIDSEVPPQVARVLDLVGLEPLPA